MAGRQPAQRRAGIINTIDDWWANPNGLPRQMEQGAEAAGRSAWTYATRSEGKPLVPVLLDYWAGDDGQDGSSGAPLTRSTPADSRAGPTTPSRSAPAPFGGGAAPGRLSPDVRGPTRTALRSPLPSLIENDPFVRSGAASLAQTAGNLVGVGQGAIDTARDTIDGAAFLGRLMNPAMDALVSPPGRSAQDQVVSAGSRALDYARNAINDPRRVGRDLRSAYYKLEADSDPNATPEAPTIAGEAARRYGIGQNQGKLGFGLATMAFGAPGLKGPGLLGDMGKAARVAKYRALGLSEPRIAYLEEPYLGQGHHSIFPQRFTLPAILGGGPLPSSLMDSPLNVLQPRGITRGQMYERHFQVDPKYNGSPLPKYLGGGGRGSGWSGRRMGLQKYGLSGRVWFGTPDATRLAIGGAGAAGLANGHQGGGARR